MKTIDALTLSRSTAETFINLFAESDVVAIKFFGHIVGYIHKDSASEPDVEISLPALCRKSKRLLQAELQSVKQMKIVSGQHDKKTVGYLVAA